ncbi:hypothetical protein YGAWVPHU_CDS0031 [Salmonella phage SeKF_13]|uniref:Uncharacterized protein n=1 Tax=Salmonella phage PMBT37 TaxID=3153515 RepID=A0AAU8GLE6_9CAUD
MGRNRQRLNYFHQGALQPLFCFAILFSSVQH